MRSLSHRLRSDAVLDRAFVWLCRQRRRWPDAADIWSFRRDWPEEKARLQAEPHAGRFRFGLQQRITRENGEEIDLWSARDALVLKALALVLGDPLSISRRCVHVKGHGGAKAAIRRIARRLPSAPFVLKTDVGERFAVRRARLQERERTGRSPPGALGLYVRRWRRWTSAGLGSMETTGLADAAEWGLGGGFSGVLCATPPSEPCQANRDQ